MADSCEDSEGEELELIRPGLIRELRNVLDEYPDDGQILKEMIQNAEDAGASCVKILADHRVFHRDVDAKIIKKHPPLKFLQGPALCMYNNEQFTKNDWKGIRMLHTSVKEKDPLKVGRFGLGFKSVFHLTDRPVIISGEFILYMDPFKSADKYCSRKRLALLKGRELESITHCLDAVFLSGSPQSLDTVFHPQSGFSGTLFWFPLRRQKSDLSDTLYTEDSLKDLLQAFKTEASSTLIFLKNLERIELFIRDDEGTKPVFTVELSKECVSAVRADRSAFKTSIRAAVEDLPLAPVCCRSEIEVVMCDLDPRSQSQHQERWLVVNYHAGREQASDQLLKLCGDPNLCYQPYVGVAMPLGGQRSFQSHLFCFLPLPLETKSPTGLPVHVNGFFALSQNRRHIKWPTADQLSNGAHMEPALTWNCLLVEELLPLAYVALLHRLKEIYNKNPDEFYKAWPDVTAVDDRWKPLARTLLETLSQETFFHTLVPTDTWIPLSEAVLQNFPSPVEPDVERAVIHIYTINRESVIRLPRHVMSGLEQFNLLTAAQSVTPQHVSELVLTHHQQLNDTDKLLLLQYLCSHDNYLQFLLDRPLLPLQDGTFGVFRRHGVDEVFWCEEQIQSLFPGLENVMCSIRVLETVGNHLRCLAESGQFSLKIVDKTSGDVARLMAMSIQRRFGTSSVRLSSHDDWIRQVWTFLQRTAPWNTDLSGLCHLAILPSIEGSQVALLPLKGNYVSLSAPGVAELNTHMVNSLSKLGITVVSLPQYVSGHKQILGGLVQYPTTSGVLAALEELSKNRLAREKGKSDFNSSSSEEERKSVRMFITNAKQLDPQRVSVLTDLTLFTEMGSRRLVSVREVNTIGPRDAPPVGPPRSLLECDESSRSAALTIGASEVNLNDIAEETLRHMCQGGYTNSDKKLFMKYFLRHSQLMANQKLTTLAREIQFLRASSGTLHKAADLYDCEKAVLRELFLGEDMFPCEEFAQSKFISKLKKLGLRDETTVKDDDLTSAAQRIQDLLAQGDRETAAKKAEGLWTLLLNQGHLFTNLGRLARIQCIPCLQDHQKPSDYPTSLPLRSTPAIVRPCEMALYTDLIYCGSVRAVMRSGMSKDVAEKLMVVRELTFQDVLSHLLNVVRCYNTKESPHYKLILHRIFERLNGWRSESSVCQFLKENDCVFVESVGRFVRPTQFWIHKRDEDIDLTPYRFPVTTEMSNVCELFQRCGSSEYQDDQLLQEVLNEIKTKYESGPVSTTEYTKDMRLVKQILDILRQSEYARSGKVLVPISHEQQDVLKFRCAKDCTLWTESSSRVFALEGNEDEEIVFVHSDISRETAIKLGVLQMKDRALTGIEDLDFGYGQHEQLTDRLHSLLKDSYTDGFSVPKELIQNADDAGATEVKFLLDERENMDARTNLINEQMASLQGPALWAFNNSTFSDKDFENIVRLGAGTKTDDGTKVGKFGLGFNSVYNLTDAPSFISRHTMAIFDPQVKYLKGPGLKLDFRKPINRALCSRMSEQFKPFQDVFGCTLTRESEVNYEGTLFRFPFRTHDQAADSKIKAEAYTESKRKEFIKMLLENAGNLLMFTQHVKVLQIYYISSKCLHPAEVECLLLLNKDSHKTVLSSKPVSLAGSVLHFAVKNWLKGKKVRVKEDLTMRLSTSDIAKSLCNVSSHDTETHWRIIWTCETTGTANSNRHGQQIPLAAVAVFLKNQRIAPLCMSPTGFYRSGHLFCFLPLPKEFVNLDLPVHINGTFELASNRRNLLSITEDDLSCSHRDWNSTLFEDAVSRAYLLILENLHLEAANESNFQGYYKLWPTIDGKNNVLSNFYLCLVKDNYKVFPDSRSNSWVSFSDAIFMDPDFRASELGQTAWETLKQFWSCDETLVDAPADFLNQMNVVGHQSVLSSKIISEFFFYERTFFPNIASSWWTKEDRDRLVLHALLHSDPNIQNLVKDNACIPCLFTSDLKRPRELIHPLGRAAKLYLPCDERFPQDSSLPINFSSEECLARLSELGMLTDTLEWDMVIERAQSVENLARENWAQAMARAKAFIDYMTGLQNNRYRYDTCPPEVLDSLFHTKFLPVMKRPENWKLPWIGDGEKNELESPSHLFSENVKDLVACTAKILDSKSFKMFTLYSSEKEKALNKMGLRTREDIKDMALLQMATEQLLIVVKEYSKNPELNVDFVQTMCDHIYKHLNNCLGSNPELKQFIQSTFSDRKIIWVEHQFEFPSRVAFNGKYNCQPYLFRLQSHLSKHRLFFEVVGVKDDFDVTDILDVFEEMLNVHGAKELPSDTMDIVPRLVQLLYDALVNTGQNSLQEDRELYLPDRHRCLQPVSLLCLDDCDWLSESDTMKFVHDSISPAVAKKLGVSSKRECDFDEMCDAIPFGQHERLTTRIKRLLEGYTFDSSVFKELIQNADDAGATEIKFIKDFRHHKMDKIPVGWENLQGPALCVFNNKSFTSADMDGIKNVGLGSKGQDLLKTGKYGVGFNAVYHITDVPSFWTREDNKEEVICVFDPNCRYLHNISYNNPGKKMRNLVRLKQNYPDVFSSYLDNCIDMTSPGTLFRLPLRTSVMAEQSEIKQIPLEETDMSDMLANFQEEMATCLLFLNNVRKIGIYTVCESGLLSTDHEVTVEIGVKYCYELNIYNSRLLQLSNSFKRNQIDLLNTPPTELSLQMTIHHSNSFTEDWIRVSRVGFCDKSIISPQFHNLWKDEGFHLPQGGVAVRLSSGAGKSLTCAENEREEHLAFCCLPLPVKTNLPVHVNGEFILDHEARRNIWENEDDGKTEWNKAIALQVIVPAYVTLIQKVKNILFQKQDSHKSPLQVRLRFYESLFPHLESAPSDFWKNVMKRVYLQLAQPGLDILPVTCANHATITWAPAVKMGGFPGYFSNLDTYFGNLDKPESLAVTQSSNLAGSNQVSHEMFRRKKDHRLIALLISLNMKIVSVHFRIFENFRESGVKVSEVTPDSVIHFLRSSGHGNADDCSLTGLPKPVNDTCLKSVYNVDIIIHFIKESTNFQCELKGLPLCLRQSHNLYFFQETSQRNKPILSWFGHLLPESADTFMHKTLLSHFSAETTQMFRELDILTFAEMLPCTLRKEHFKTGVPCTPDEIKPLPCQRWIKEAWSFFQTLVTQSADPPSQERCILEVLSEWSLVPVTWRVKESVDPMLSKISLYPMKSLSFVLNLTDTKDTSNARLWEILSHLPLPNLDHSRLPENTFASKFSASFCNPLALLHALNSLERIPELSPENAVDILRYFSNNLPVLTSSCDDEVKLKKCLGQLPLFTSVDGKLHPIGKHTTVICIENDIAHEGLAEWSKHTHHLLILKQNTPEELARYLNFAKTSIETFYSCHLLPQISYLPRRAIKRHIEFLKSLLQSSSAISNSDYTDLGLQLKKTPFIEGKDGHLYKASTFYSPHEPVFKVMYSPDVFPPAPYSNRDWKNFMESVGMISLITVDMFIGFAKKLAKEGRNKITQHVENASMTLLMCLFDKMDFRSGDLLSRVKDIPFVMPSTWRQDEASKALTNITPAFCPERLVSFSESCRESHLYLVWSSSAILNPKADPYKLLDITDQELIGSQLGIQEGAPASKVVQHLKNICDVLTGQESQQAIQTLKRDTNLIRKVMKKLYKYLSCVTEEIYIEVLKSLPIVYHIESNRMLHTENVVIEITKDNEIDGFLMKAPHEFGDFFNLFKRLGVAEHVTADHYARVLQGLKTCAGEKQLHVEEMKKVAQAVKGLFSCLNLNSQNESSLLVEDLYLPSEEGVLRKSSELIFVDDFILHSRLKALPPNKSFFIGFQKLEIYNFSRMNIKQLPDKYGMSLLTSVVKETVPDCLRSQAVDSKMSRDLAANMTHPTVIEAVARVMYHSFQERNISFPENPIETIAEKLSHISVREISGLETVLMVNDQVVPKSKQKTSEFVCKHEDVQKTCLVYIDTNILRLRGETDMKVFNSAIVAAMVFVLEFESVWLKTIVDDVRLAQQSMDKNRVLPLDLSMRDNRSVIPPAGDFVPVSHHCYLDNSFYYFIKGEHVGFEVYDPCEDEEDLADTAPVYIYGIIVQETGGDGQVDTNLLSKKYLVDLGPERGQIEITATRLYKFIRKNCESTSFDLVQYSGLRNETPECVEEQSLHQDLKTVLREIRRLLIEASLLLESERRRVHKRLILKWHPDKNPGKETFCTEVMKALNRYLVLLRQGKVLHADEDDDDDDDDDDKEKTFHSRSSPSTFSSTFFEYMYRRGTRHRRDFDCHEEEFNTRCSSGQYKERSHNRSFSESTHQGGPSFSAGSNPQPGEGRRWFRQAEADLQSAKAAKGTCAQGYNWVCFMCHQAVEKALKAVLYCRDANGYALNSHEIVLLAQHVSDDEIIQTTCELETLVGSHTRMRYPDVLLGPCIPADVYDDQKASRACGMAGGLLNKVKTLL